MRGNSHVRFLGGGGVAMRCCYPPIIIIKIENEKPFVNRLFRLQIIVILADIYARKC